jgi:methylenetetrahydrofolate reductase (NADPH)
MEFFKKLSSDTDFPLCYNLLPHFASGGGDIATYMKFVEDGLTDSRIKTFLVSDHSTHSRSFSTLQLAEEILAAGGQPVVSLALAGINRETALSKLRDYRLAGIQEFLFVTGNYPVSTENETESPSFDIDSVQLLMLLENHHEAEGISKGCVVSPFKTLESEQVWQYEKLKRKISVGADFVITQQGYDLRKFHELVRFCALHEITKPLVANIFATDLHDAYLLFKRGIPGVRIPGSLLETLEQEENNPQAAKENKLARVAKTLCVLKGLGYHGALLGSSNLDFLETKQVLDQAKELGVNWEDFLQELDHSDSSFYYFQKDRQNGLNTSEPSAVAAKHYPYLLYSFSYFVDWLVYVPQGPMFKLTGRFCHFSSNRKFWYSFLWFMEYLSKGPLYGCKMCGDCTLYACGFLCYQSGCPKKIVNGPCGGSIDGHCEVYPDKKNCYWVKVYEHMKGVRQHVTFVAPPIPARDTSLNRTSSWINFFMGRDHRKIKIGDDQAKILSGK